MCCSQDGEGGRGRERGVMRFFAHFVQVDWSSKSVSTVIDIVKRPTGIHIINISLIIMPILLIILQMLVDLLVSTVSSSLSVAGTPSV